MTGRFASTRVASTWTIALTAALVGVCLTSGVLAAQGSEEVHHFPVNGFDMVYETMGDGPPLLLVHGWSGNADYFEPLLDDLAAGFQLIIPELRGHGRSTNSGGPFSTRQTARDIVALLDHLGLQDIPAIGASAGALTLLHVAEERPEALRGMVLVGAGTHFTPQCAASMAATDADALAPSWWAEMRKRHHNDDEKIRAIAHMLPELAALDGDVAFTPEILQEIETPTLIVHGDSDWCFPPSMAAAMHEALPTSALWVIPRGEHVPILGEHAPLFLERVREFVGSLAVDGLGSGDL